jgi:ribosomal protein L11 methyltransferase
MTDYILEISYDAADDELEEVVQSRLFLAGTSGSTWREAAGTRTVEAYFESAAARDAAAALFDNPGVVLASSDRERVDWLQMYQQSLHPIAIGSRFVVAPDPALIAEDEKRLQIVVPQEQAFGTGSHETTALCIEMLEECDLDGRRGLDIGSGSGILAIAMLRLGAERAIAFDNDADAYGPLRDNRLRNAIEADEMPLFIGDVEAMRGGQFDVVTMNIIPEVIIPLLPAVAARLAPRAKLILSGILTARADDVIRAAERCDLALTKRRERGEWWCGVFA